MLALLKWLLVLGTLAAFFALVPVGGRTLLERAQELRGDFRHAGRAGESEEDPSATAQPPAATPAPPRRSVEHAHRPAPLPEERHSASDHAALDRLVTERAR